MTQYPSNSSSHASHVEAVKERGANDEAKHQRDIRARASIRKLLLYYIIDQPKLIPKFGPRPNPTQPDPTQPDPTRANPSTNFKPCNNSA